VAKYKGIIFDLDGTLINTIDDIAESMNEVLEQYKYPIFTNDEYKMKIGEGFKNLIVKAMPEEVSDTIIEEATELFNKIYYKKYLNRSRPYVGIDTTLDKLVARNIRLGIHTNKRNYYTNFLIDKYFNRIPFIEVYGECAGIPTKPSPILTLKIIEKMNLRPEEVLYVGDSTTDILTAQNAGIHSVAVLWGFRSYEELKKYGAKYIISKPDELLDII